VAVLFKLVETIRGTIPSRFKPNCLAFKTEEEFSSQQTSDCYMSNLACRIITSVIEMPFPL